MENKQLICNLLMEAIKATRAGSDIKCLFYDSYHEWVLVYDCKDNVIRKINVACDSGIAMIRDIMRYIDIG